MTTLLLTEGDLETWTHSIASRQRAPNLSSPSDHEYPPRLSMLNATLPDEPMILRVMGTFDELALAI
jgi:hypothetical protein